MDALTVDARGRHLSHPVPVESGEKSPEILYLAQSGERGANRVMKGC